MGPQPKALGARSALKTLPRGVWALGLVSLFMDISSEMIHALLPVYLVTSLGASVATVGWLEGLAEATASVTRVFSGALSDRLRRRKLLAVIGYALAACTKPIFALAPTATWVFAARLTDRVGKGIRGAPRDALVGDLAPRELRGASYGLRQTLDTVGAFAGPVLAVGLMALTHNHFRLVFWLAVIPAGVAVWLLVAFVREPDPAVSQGPPGDKPLVADLSRTDKAWALGRHYWWLVVVAALFTLARFSEAFLVLKVSETGLPATYVPLVLVVMNAAYALSAYPAGFVSDRLDRFTVIIAGAGLLIAADLVLAVADSVSVALLGAALWGLHMGFSQGLFAALIADASATSRRGTAFGLFNLLTGVVLLCASVLAGSVWESQGSKATFLLGAALTAVAVTVTLGLRRWGCLPTSPAALNEASPR